MNEKDKSRDLIEERYIGADAKEKRFMFMLCIIIAIALILSFSGHTEKSKPETIRSQKGCCCEKKD